MHLFGRRPVLVVRVLAEVDVPGRSRDAADVAARVEVGGGQAGVDVAAYLESETLKSNLSEKILF